MRKDFTPSSCSSSRRSVQMTSPSSSSQKWRVSGNRSSPSSSGYAHFCSTTKTSTRSFNSWYRVAVSRSAAQERLSTTVDIIALCYHTSGAGRDPHRLRRVRGVGRGRGLREPKGLVGPIPDFVEQGLVLRELHPERGDQLAQPRGPVGVLAREALLQHVEHGGDAGRGSRRGAEQAGDAAVARRDDRGAQLEHAADALAADDLHAL